MLGMTAEGSSARRRRVSYQVANLRAQVSALETVMAQVIAKPGKEPVHQLRSVTRKVEAQFAVLRELAGQEPGFQVVESSARRVEKLLDKVRRAAGRVRDLDVQQALAQEFAGEGATASVRREVREIRKQLRADRAVAAEDLVSALSGHGRRLAPQLEALMTELKPVEAVGMSPVEQEVMTRGWYASQLDVARQDGKLVRAMHRIRKAAKLARYMAENGLAARVVEEFKAMQEAGGRWHDCRILLNAARRRLGKRSGLAALLKEREATARGSFQALVGN